jgi:hypothetical protein
MTHDKPPRSQRDWKFTIIAISFVILVIAILYATRKPHNPAVFGDPKHVEETLRNLSR